MAKAESLKLKAERLKLKEKKACRINLWAFFIQGILKLSINPELSK